jgi:hypothetical protein
VRQLLSELANCVEVKDDMTTLEDVALIAKSRGIDEKGRTEHSCAVSHTSSVERGTTRISSIALPKVSKQGCSPGAL